MGDNQNNVMNNTFGDGKKSEFNANTWKLDNGKGIFPDLGEAGAALAGVVTGGVINEKGTNTSPIDLSANIQSEVANVGLGNGNGLNDTFKGGMTQSR